MRAPLVLAWMLIFTTTFAAGKYSLMSSEYPTKSGLRSWVDPDTPVDRKTYTTSRGRQWELIMSDEFNVADRSFRPGDDHMWTSIEKPDGVNGALEIYSHNMTSTKCDDDGNCYFYIEVASDNTTFSVYNMYKHPPGYQNTTFYYRAAMVQSWNKFCYQGGMLEVRAQLPGAVSAASGNPDLARGNNEQVTDTSYYPSWPGIWMMGNLGRAIFSASTNRMWPFSYDRCEPDIFDPSNQRISACDNDPGYGLNTNQGRGAPEIDLLEGGGLAISSSLQIAPGMPSEFRLFPPDPDGIDATNPNCVYAYDCKTEGANLIDVPTAYYKQKRGHKSWYQSLRYSSNNRCAKKSANVQSFATVDASVRRGITENSCTTTTCPASLDLNGNMDLIDGTGRNHWGINSNGTCFPVMNSYMGAYLCDPDSTDARCASPRPTTTEKSNAMDPFNYQMDAISSNWPVHLGVYTDFIVYQLEWVTGGKGYVRWMLDGSPLFEVAADTVSNVPQNRNSSNPQKLMLEEPMSVIFNVALSSSWGATPPNAGNACRGDGSDKKVNKICNEFPMFMKIDYIRLYQDQGDDLDTDNYMQVGCDPASHPTKQWIQGHINEYQDNDNPVMEVIGKAFCKTNSDCTVGGNYAQTGLVTGLCVESRCSCLHPKSWNGPRCTIAQSESKASTRVYGPSIMLAVGVAAIVAFVLFVLMWNGCRSTAKKNQALIKARTMFKTNSDARVANAASISNV